MIENILYTYLGDNLSLPVFSEVPKSPPLKYYAFERTGGAQVNHIYESTIAIQSVGTSLWEAIEMNEELKKVMLYGLIEKDEIIKVELNSDYNFTDASTKKYRYQAVFDIRHY